MNSRSDVIDFHVHVGDFQRLRADIQRLLMQRKTEQDFDLEKLISHPKELARYLRREGVEKAVILAEDGPGTNYHITTDFVCDFRDAAAEDASMFIAFGCMNPITTPDLLKKYESDLRRGIRGYKLYPADHNYHPITDDLVRFYQRLESDGLILMFHTGATGQEDGVDEYGDPAIFRPILDQFPSLTVVMAHAGKGSPIYCKEAERCALQYANCYLDTAFIAAEKLLVYQPNLEKFSDKILFGSDWPAGVRSLSGHIADLRHSGISSHSLELILSANARKVLRLD
jgi:predicted TIM-barrel fold metal-dependent hydrolase